MLNIVIPMAGRGQRFADAGYALPKPLIPVHGTPMIKLVIDNLRPSQPHRFIFLVLEEHLASHGLASKLSDWAPASVHVPVAGVTAGAACTVLLARSLIDNDEPLMIANCDQYIETSIDTYLAANQGADGLIMTMFADDPKWSFVRRDFAGKVTEVIEKVVVSNEATVGIYNFASGRQFVAAADEMIARDLRVNGEYYVAPVYNVMIERGATIQTYAIGRVGDGMHGIGTPSDLDAFLIAPVSQFLKR